MKFLKTLLVFVIVSLAYSCSSDDEAEYIPLEIASSNVTFDAYGGEGNISLNSQEIAKVVSADDWCSVTYDGSGAIRLNVDANPLRADRNTVITVTGVNGSEAHIAVSQAGSDITLEDDDMLNFGYNDSTAVVRIAHSNVNVELNVKSEGDWLTAEQVGDSIIVSAAKNSTGKMRTGVVYFQFFGHTKDSVAVVQSETKDLYGDYYMIGDAYNGFPSDKTFLKVSLSQADSANKIKFSLPDYDITVDLDIDPTTHEYVIPTGLGNKLKDSVEIHLQYYDYTGEPADRYDSFITFLLVNSTIYVDLAEFYVANLNCTATFTYRDDAIAWKLNFPPSPVGIGTDCMVLYNYYEYQFKGANVGIYFAAQNVYMIPANKYHPQ